MCQSLCPSFTASCRHSLGYTAGTSPLFRSLLDLGQAVRVFPPVDPRGPELSRAETSLIWSAVTCPGLPVSSGPVSLGSSIFHPHPIAPALVSMCLRNEKPGNLCARLCVPCSGPFPPFTIWYPHLPPPPPSPCLSIIFNFVPCPLLFTQLQNEGMQLLPFASPGLNIRVFLAPHNSGIGNAIPGPNLL